MRTKNYVGFRLNENKDKDIIMDLAKYSDTTNRVKEVYRKMLELEKQLYIMQLDQHKQKVVEQHRQQRNVVHEEVAAEEVQHTKVEDKQPLVWNFPTEPTIKKDPPTTQTGKSNILKSNILKNNF